MQHMKKYVAFLLIGSLKTNFSGSVHSQKKMSRFLFQNKQRHPCYIDLW